MDKNISERLKMYEKTKETITKMQQDKIPIKNSVFFNQIILIKNDINSGEELLQKSAKDMLEFIFSCGNNSVQNEIINLLNEKTTSKDLEEAVLTSIQQCFLNLIKQKPHNVIKFLYQWIKCSRDKILELFQEICTVLKSFERKNFLVNHVLPSMTIIHNVYMVDVLVEVGNVLITFVSISDLDSEEVKTFLSDLSKFYDKEKCDKEAKEVQFDSWDKLWQFFIKFLGKELHNSISTTNTLLRVVEVGFRSPSIPQRLKSYDCWKTLIDNASLDSNYLCSPKQLKLLLTPLKAKMSKQEAVIIKRFEVFIHLLKKLNNNAFLIIKEFLEFCFGDVSQISGTKKIKLGNSPKLWKISIKTFLEIIGHNDFVGNNFMDPVLRREEPIITPENFENYNELILNTAIEITLLLKQEDLQDIRNVALISVWTTIFNLVLNSSDEMKQKSLQKVVDNLNNLMKDANDLSLGICSKIVASLFCFDQNVLENVMVIVLPPVLQLLLSNPQELFFDESSLKILHQIQSFCQPEKASTFKIIVESFSEMETLHGSSVQRAFEIWVSIDIDVGSGFSPEIVQFLCWSTKYLNGLNEEGRTRALTKWAKIFSTTNEVSDQNKKLLLISLTNIFNNNPILTPNIILIVSTAFQFEKTFSNETVLKFLNLTELLLNYPLLQKTEEEKLAAVIAGMLNSNLTLYTSSDAEESVVKLAKCLGCIFEAHKNFGHVSTATQFLKQIPDRVKMKFAAELKKQVFSGSKTSDIDKVQLKELQSMLNSILDKPEFIPSRGRSAKIANLTKQIPKSPQLVKQNESSSPNNLILFGKNVDTLNSHRVKGSFLQKLINSEESSPKKTKPIKDSPKKAAPSIDEESTSDFVPINTEVKVDLEKMPEHQKELFNKRSEDIPALYEDLTQSQSQDLLNLKSTDTNSNKINQNTSLEDQKIEQKPKVSSSPLPKQIVVNLHNVLDSSFEQKPELANIKISPKPSKKKFSPKNKIESELKKLKMDIVGAEQYQRSSRSTRAEKNKKKDLVKVEPKRGRKKKSLEGENDDRRKSTSALKDSPLRKDNIVKRNSTGSFEEVKKEDRDTVIDSTPIESPSLVEAKILQNNNSQNLSQDVIESSQEQTMNESELTSSRSRRGRKRSAESYKNTESPQNGFCKDEIDLKKITEEVESQPDYSQKDISEAETLTCDSNVKSLTPNVQLDVLNQPELSDSERILCNMDTISFISESDLRQDTVIMGTPKPKEVETNSNTLSTPVTACDSLPSSPVTGDTPTRTSELLDNTMDISPIKMQSGEMENGASVKNDIENKELWGFKERSNKLLNKVSAGSPVTRRNFYKRLNASVNMSPSKARTKKLMMRFNQKTMEEERSDGDEVPFDADVLTFSREVPSPLAVPKSSILKRKMTDSDGASPCPKRKRVNFSYPTTTSKKVFIKEDKSSEFSLQAKLLFGDTEADDESNIDDVFSQLDNEDPKNSLNAEVSNKGPVYPSLQDSKGDLLDIIKKLVNPSHVNLVMEQLQDKNVKTIGDFAMLKEADLNKLPIAGSIFETVSEELHKYYLLKKKEEIIETSKRLKDLLQEARIEGVDMGDIDELKEFLPSESESTITESNQVSNQNHMDYSSLNSKEILAIFENAFNNDKLTKNELVENLILPIIKKNGLGNEHLERIMSEILNCADLQPYDNYSGSTSDGMLLRKDVFNLISTKVPIEIFSKWLADYLYKIPSLIVK